MPTRSDILRAAFRRIAVTSADEALTADQEAYASDVLDGLVQELSSAHGLTVDADAPTDEYMLALAWLLAVHIAPHYMVQAEPRSRATMRLRSIMIDNDLTADVDAAYY